MAHSNTLRAVLSSSLSLFFDMPHLCPSSTVAASNFSFLNVPFPVISVFFSFSVSTMSNSNFSVVFEPTSDRLCATTLYIHRANAKHISILLYLNSLEMLGSGIAKCESSRFSFHSVFKNSDESGIYVCVLFTDHVANLLLFFQTEYDRLKERFLWLGISMMPHITYFYAFVFGQTTHTCCLCEESNFNMSNARFSQWRLICRWIGSSKSGCLGIWNDFYFSFSIQLVFENEYLNGFRILSDERFKLNLFFWSIVQLLDSFGSEPFQCLWEAKKQ